MVNHMRTLILNEPAGTGIYVPAGFVPVPVPRMFAGLREALVPQNRDLTGRVAAADAVMRLCGTPELYPYLTKFDRRITYGTAADADIVSMCRADAATDSETTMLAQRLAAVPASVLTPLFAWQRYVADMSALRMASANTCEAVLRIGAVALAYAYQIERVRIGD